MREGWSGTVHPLPLSPIVRVGAVLRALRSAGTGREPAVRTRTPPALTRSAAPFGDPRAHPPSNAFVPVPGCWVCLLLDDVAHAAWRGDDGLRLADWLSVTASGMGHRVRDHGDPPTP
ncbi:hypothetical protein P3T26_005793 [Streptomyces sp. MAA16]|nr:hypothetical protein [Streptomyces sp. MAA16]